MDKYIEALNKMQDRLDNSNSLDLSALNSEETAVIVIDIVNGFAKEGILSSDRVKSIIPEIAQLMDRANDANIETICFADFHSDNSLEIKRLGKHCVGGTSESEIVKELQDYEYELMLKDSTNGVLTASFGKWLSANQGKYKNFIIVGCVTDICVYNFATTLRAVADEMGGDIDIFVPINMVETYDYEHHVADLYNLIFLTAMKDYGINVVKEVY